MSPAAGTNLTLERLNKLQTAVLGIFLRVLVRARARTTPNSDERNLPMLTEITSSSRVPGRDSFLPRMPWVFGTICKKDETENDCSSRRSVPLHLTRYSFQILRFFPAFLLSCFAACGLWIITAYKTESRRVEAIEAETFLRLCSAGSWISSSTSDTLHSSWM